MAKKKLAIISEGAANVALPADELSTYGLRITDVPSTDFNSVDPTVLSSAPNVQDIKNYFSSLSGGTARVLKVEKHTVPDHNVIKYITLANEVSTNTDVMVQVIGGSVQIPASIDALNSNFSVDSISKDRIYTFTENTPSVQNEAHVVSNPIPIGTDLIIVYQTEE